MGPRPPSVQWPAVQKSKGKGKGKSVDHSSNPSHVPSRSRRWRARSQIPTQDGLNPEIRVNPNSAEAERVEQIRKLEQAIEILGKDSPQSTGLIAHLKKLQAASSSPIGERLDACQRFVERAQKRLAAAQEAVKKAVETQSKLEAELQEGVERLQRLREEATAQMSSMRVEPPDEVSSIAESNFRVGTRGTIESAHSRGRCPTHHPSSFSGRNQPVEGCSARIAVRTRFSQIRDVQEPGGRGSIPFDVHVDRPRRFVAERGWIEQIQSIVVIWRSRHGLRGVRVGEASNPGPPRLRFVNTPSQVPTTVPANSREARGVHGRLDVVAMDENDTVSVVSSVSFEEGFDRVLVDREHAEEDVEEVDDGASVVSGVEDPVQEETVPLDLPEVRDNSPHIREAFRRMDRVDVENIFRRRAVVMKTIPFFLRGLFRVTFTLRIALAEANAPEHVRRARGWKLFLLLPRMLLTRSTRGGLISKEKLRRRFESFNEGRWEELIRDSEVASNQASVAMHRKRRRHTDESERRARRAHTLVQLGEVSAGRAALESAELAPGSEETRCELTDPRRRPSRAREPIAQHILNHVPDTLFILDEDVFAKNVRSARKGAAPGPSGMTVEHLRPLLDNPRDTHMLFGVAEQLAQGLAPEAAIQALRLGRLTVLRKPTGGVRGIVG